MGAVGHDNRQPTLIFSPMVLVRRQILVAEMVAALITTAIHRNHADLGRHGRPRSGLVQAPTNS